MSDFTRRDALKVLGAAGVAAAVPRPLRADLPPELRRAAVAAEQALLLGGLGCEGTEGTEPAKEGAAASP